MPCEFKTNPSSGVPLYRQIYDQTMAQIASGRLAEGEMLPSVRELSAQLQINPMTVSKAYSQLHAASVLERLHGAGMRVAANASKGSMANGSVEPLEPLISQLIVQARQSGVKLDQIENELKRLWSQPGKS